MKKIVSQILFLGTAIVFPGAVFARGEEEEGGGASGGWSPNNYDSSNLPQAAIIDIIIAVMEWILYAVGFFAVIAFAISGILYLTSAGDDNQIERAKRGMTYAIIGTIVAIAGLTALYFAHNLLNGLNDF